MDILSLWQSFLASPIASYLALILLFVLICVIIGSILRGLLRFVFRSIRFVVCLVLAVLLISFLMGKFAVKPSVKPPMSIEAQSAINLAVERYKGIYAPKLPLIAWRFSEYSSNEVTLKEADETDKQDADDYSYVRVQYLPFGETLLRYDPENEEFKLQKKLSEGKGAALVNLLFKQARELMPQ